MIGDRNEPTGGVPSLTDGEIVQLYLKYLRREPDARELASERENALKYSAAGIENQISLRAGNAPASGIRGDEGQAPLTIPAPQIIASHAGNVATFGAAAIAPGATGTGPTGTIAALYGQPSASGSPMGVSYAGAGPSLGGLNVTTIAILAVVAGAAWYFFVKK